jgi:hypothetical protein
VIDTITIVSCDAAVGAVKSAGGNSSECVRAVESHMLSVTLYDGKSKLIPHDVLSAGGHSIAPGCAASPYLVSTLDGEAEALLRQFGRYASPEAFSELTLNARNIGGIRLLYHFKEFASEYEQTPSACDRKRRNPRQDICIYQKEGIRSLVGFFEARA